MSPLLRFLTSQKTTLFAVLAGLALFMLDSSVIATLHELGLSVGVTAKLVAAGKLLTLALAALGYSPLSRPPVPTPEP
ncbi:MAG: hypothetical protein V4617_15070 [Gemmatimonadota bacterium]